MTDPDIAARFTALEARIAALESKNATREAEEERQREIAAIERDRFERRQAIRRRIMDTEPSKNWIARFDQELAAVDLAEAAAIVSGPDA